MKKIGDAITFILALVKVAAFFGLVALLIPFALIGKKAAPEHPFVLPRIFHGLLLKVLGIHLEIVGIPTKTAPTLFVANHASYLDIPILSSLILTAFVAKSDVADWPLFGFLSKMQNTIFIERRSIRTTKQLEQIRAHIAKKQNLVLFPEGTSSDGLGVLRFKSSLFSLFEGGPSEKFTAIQPISITCIKLNGRNMSNQERATYAWYGDMTLPPHLWNVFKNGRFTVQVIFHDPMAIGEESDRKSLASTCQAIVARGIEQSLSG